MENQSDRILAELDRLLEQTQDVSLFEEIQRRVQKRNARSFETLSEFRKHSEKKHAEVFTDTSSTTVSIGPPVDNQPTARTDTKTDKSLS